MLETALEPKPITLIFSFKMYVLVNFGCSIPARKGLEDCQARSRCSVIIWFTGWMSKGMQLIGSQPVWERSSAATVQLPDPHFRACSRLSGKQEGCAPTGVPSAER